MKVEPPKTAEELLERYENGERLFEDIDADEEWDLNNAILQDAQFLKCWFSASFHNANLRNTIFRECNIKGSDFEGADLTNAAIINSALCGTYFKDAVLNNANFAGSHWHSYVFEEGDDLANFFQY